jgi:DNA-binding NtrC family response regulator
MCHFNQPMIACMDSVMEIKSLKNKEEELLREVLEKTHWDLVKTARLLKITLSQVKRKIKEFSLERTDDP